MADASAQMLALLNALSGKVMGVASPSDPGAIKASLAKYSGIFKKAGIPKGDVEKYKKALALTLADPDLNPQHLAALDPKVLEKLGKLDWMTPTGEPTALGKSLVENYSTYLEHGKPVISLDLDTPSGSPRVSLIEGEGGPTKAPLDPDELQRAFGERLSAKDKELAELKSKLDDLLSKQVRGSRTKGNITAKLFENITPTDLARLKKLGIEIPEGVSPQTILAPLAEKILGLGEGLDPSLAGQHQELTTAFEQLFGETKAGKSIPAKGMEDLIGKLGGLKAAQAGLAETAAKTKAAEAAAKEEAARLSAGRSAEVFDEFASGQIPPKLGWYDKLLQKSMGPLDFKAVRNAAGKVEMTPTLNKYLHQGAKAIPGGVGLALLSELVGRFGEYVESRPKFEMLRAQPVRTTGQALEDLQNERFLQGQALSDVTKVDPKVLQVFRSLSKPQLSTGEFIAGRNPMVAGIEDGSITEDTIRELMQGTL